MRKKDNIKLNVISNIDEKIIDEATDMKISLSGKGNASTNKRRKILIAVGAVAAIFILIPTVLFSFIIPLLGSDVPVYQGMTIRKESAAVSLEQTTNGGITLLSTTTYHGGPKDDHKERDENLKNDIKDIVDIDVVTDDEVKYYVEQNETFIIEIHISNPNNYEIQSFTLNGKKYANYMFKEGSTMEVLLLEVTAPITPGYTEYTIDAIKYIDGTEIKDVDMSSGNKSVKAGVAYPTAPSAVVTSHSVSTTYIELSINVSDPYSLTRDNELSVYISDGEKIVDSKPLHVGDNSVTFTDLIMSKTYEYGVVAVFDLVDGNDMHKEWLLTNTVTTAEAFGINNAVPTQDSISFEVYRIADVGSITSVSLYDADTDELVELVGAYVREFKNLLSNHAYNLYVDFTYTVNGTEIQDWVAIKGITTLAKVAPVLTFSESTADKTSVSYAVEAVDPDGILNVTKSELLQNGEYVNENGTNLSGRFNGLLSNNTYTVQITYTYDLNDGRGVLTEYISKDIKTVAKATPVLTFSESTADKTSVSYAVKAVDRDGILNVTKTELLRKGEYVNENGTNLSGGFDGLLSNNTYTVKITYTYDLNDGRGVLTEYISKDIKTVAKATPVLTFSESTADKTSVSYAVKAVDRDGILNVTKTELLRKGEYVNENGTNLSGGFDGLLSNNTYTVKITYTYDLNDGRGVLTKYISKDIKTVAKATPVVKFSNMSATDSNIAGEFNMEDDDSLGTVTSVGIYNNGALLQDNASKEVDFSGLKSYTDYQIVVRYTFDLNDGVGVRTVNATYDIKTLPHLVFNSCTVANTSAVSEGDTIFMQINITNPDRVVYQKVVVNGMEYDVVKNSSTATMLYCEIVNNGQFEGGETTLTVEKVMAERDGNTYTIEPGSNNSASVFINGKLGVERIYPVVLKDGEYVESYYYIAPRDQAYVMIEFSNKTGYNIDSVNVKMYEDSTATVTETVLDIVKVDNEHYLIPIEYAGRTFTEIKYSKDGINKTVSIQERCNRIFTVESDEVHSVSTAEDLLNMHGRGYYELTNDIDLSGIEWRGSDFCGVFNGNGYSIKNMSFVATISNSNAYLGLFTSAEGVIKNLNLKNVKYIVKQESSAEYHIYYGGITAKAVDFLIIDNCSIDEDSFVNVDGDQTGGFVGITTAGGIDGMYIITNCVNNGTVTGNGCVGGIVGGYDDPPTIFKITNCVNNGNVTGSDSVGGIIGGNYAPIITNCVNNGNVTGNDCVGGIVGIADFGSSITNCENNGNVTGNGNVGGIAGIGYSITNCVNNGDVTGNEDIGGIAGTGCSITNCENNGTVTGNKHVGGIAGMCDSVINCVNNGNVTGNDRAGGITGGIDGSKFTITNCENNGNVTGNGNVGGIAGIVYSITNCVNNGNVTSKGSSGGIAAVSDSITNCVNNGDVTTESCAGGIAYTISSVTNCVNNGNVTGNKIVGGIAGANGPITNCVNNGDVTGNEDVGGIVGFSRSIITNCVNNGNVKGGGIVGRNDGATITDCYVIGNNITIDKLNSKQFYTEVLSFDESIWNLDDLDVANGKYPTLK